MTIHRIDRLSPRLKHPASILLPKHDNQIQKLYFLEVLQSRFGYRLGRFIKAGKRATYPLRLVQAQQQIADRLVLLGNAAHTLSPIAGQGFNLGLRDVALLAQVIAQALANKQDFAASPVLKNYLSLRRRDQLQITFLTDTLARFFAHAPLGLNRLGDVGMILVDILQPLHQLLLKNTMGMHCPLSNLACGLPLMEA